MLRAHLASIYRGFAFSGKASALLVKEYVWSLTHDE
jgi:hypothetical protein